MSSYESEATQALIALAFLMFFIFALITMLLNLKPRGKKVSQQYIDKSKKITRLTNAGYVFFWEDISKDKISNFDAIYYERYMFVFTKYFITKNGDSVLCVKKTHTHL